MAKSTTPPLPRHAAQPQAAGSDPGYRYWPGSIAAGSAIGRVHFEADADHPCRLARNHFSRLQRARATQCDRHPCFDGFGSRLLWRHFLDLGVGPALWRPDPDFQRTDAQRLAPAREMRPMKATLIESKPP